MSVKLASRELSFTVSGPSDTTGYVDVTIAKDMISNISDLHVYLDGTTIEYTASSIDDSWLLSFTYQHSTNHIVISNVGLTTLRKSRLIIFYFNRCSAC